MDFDHLKYYIEIKDYFTVYNELIDIGENLTVNEMIEGGLSYEEAKVCRILLKEDKTVREAITKLKLDVSLLLIFEDLNTSLKKAIISAISKKPNVTPGHLNRKVAKYLSDNSQKDLKKENEKIFQKLNPKNFIHFIEKARQFGQIKPNEKKYLETIVSRLEKQSYFRKWNPLNELKNILYDLFDSNIASKSCGFTKEPCSLCIEIDKALKEIFADEIIELET